jgi:non-heme chloroperoxidase
MGTKTTASKVNHEFPSMSSQNCRSFRKATVELPELALRYVECGSGPTVVLLHGYTDSWHSFRLVLPLLAPHCRCLVLDQRAHGASRYIGNDYTQDAFAGDVSAFLDHMGIASATLVGHSMGSFIARKVALNRPELVDRLVLIGSGLSGNNPFVWSLKSQVVQFPILIPRTFAEALQSSCVFNRKSVPDWFFKGSVARSARVPAHVWRAALAGLIADDHSSRLSDIARPTLVIGGREDNVFSWTEQEELACKVPASRLVLYRDVGHSPHWEQPKRFAKDLLEYLEVRD